MDLEMIFMQYIKLVVGICIVMTRYQIRAICMSTTNSKNILEYKDCWQGTYLSRN